MKAHLSLNFNADPRVQAHLKESNTCRVEGERSVGGRHGYVGYSDAFHAKGIFPTGEYLHCGCGWSSLRNDPGDTRGMFPMGPGPDGEMVNLGDHLTPRPMVLACPECGWGHVDEGEWATTRHHKTHLCAKCGHKWRPFEYPTVGVA